VKGRTVEDASNGAGRRSICDGGDCGSTAGTAPR
jgi:hypothetical protein